MQIDQKISIEEEYQQTILDLALSIIDNGYDDKTVQLLTTAIYDYMMITPDYCDLSVVFFVQYVYYSIINDPMVNKSGISYKDKQTYESFIFRGMQRETIKIHSYDGSDVLSHDKCCKEEESFAHKLFMEYRSQFQTQRNLFEFENYNDPIVMEKINLLLDIMKRDK